MFDGANRIPSEYQDFDVDIKHFMENLREHYTFPIEEAVIVENVDNCIDERYHTIDISLKGNSLSILMTGDGMDEDIFRKTLTTIAATTKIEERKAGALGRYGWGMKISMSIADFVIIETKKGTFHQSQSWKLIEGKPKYRMEQSTIDSEEDFTAVTIQLSEGYKSRMSDELVRLTLQKFYPTILKRTKVSNRHGEKRELTLSVNSIVVGPPPEIEFDKRTPISVEVQGKKTSGYVYLAKEKLPREEQGIKIIVNGRKITEDFFGVYGSENERITGYIHADVLIDDLAGDKTSLKRNTSRWRQLSEGVAKQLSVFMKEIGAIREEKLPEKMFREIQLEVNTLIKYFPELQDLAKRAGISFGKDVLIPKQNGEVSAKMEEGADLQHGTSPGSTGGSGVPVSLGDRTCMAPTDQSGDSAATKRRRRGGMTVLARPEPTYMSEAWFSPGEGAIIVNSSFPTFKKAEKMGSKTYHMIRCAIESLIEHASRTGIIEKEKAESYRVQVLAKWGEL
jgi:hypothetical protein